MPPYHSPPTPGNEWVTFDPMSGMASACYNKNDPPYIAYYFIAPPPSLSFYGPLAALALEFDGMVW